MSLTISRLIAIDPGVSPGGFSLFPYTWTLIRTPGTLKYPCFAKTVSCTIFTLYEVLGQWDLFEIPLSPDRVLSHTHSWVRTLCVLIDDHVPERGCSRTSPTVRPRVSVVSGTPGLTSFLWGGGGGSSSQYLSPPKVKEEGDENPLTFTPFVLLFDLKDCYFRQLQNSLTSPFISVLPV